MNTGQIPSGLMAMAGSQQGQGGGGSQGAGGVGPQAAAAAQGAQAAMAAVMAKLKSQPPPTAGWQAEIPIQDRWKIVNQIASSLRLVQGELDAPHAVKMAEVFEEHTFRSASSKEEYIGACRGKMQQIQETRMRKQADTEQLMRDQQFLNRNNPQLAAQQQQQLLLARQMGLQAAGMQAQAQNQNPNQQQMQGMMPQNMNIAAAMANNPALQAQMAMAAQTQPGLVPNSQQHLNALPPSNPLHQYRNMPKEQAIEHLSKTMMAQAQPQHIQTILTQLGALSDEQKAQCERLKITPVEMFFRNAAAKKLLQSQIITAGMAPGMPGMPPGATPQQQQQQQQQLNPQQIANQQIHNRQAQLAAAQQQQQQQARLMQAQAGLGRGQNLGQPQAFDNKHFMNDIQSYLKQQPGQSQVEAMAAAAAAQKAAAAAVQQGRGMPNSTMAPQGTPSLAGLTPQQQQQQILLLRQQQAAAQQQQRLSQQSPSQTQQANLVGQHPSPQLNLLNQTHRPGTATSQQAAQAAQAQAQLNQARMAELQARQNQLQQQQQHQAGMGQRPPGNFQIPPGFPIHKFQNLPPEQLQQAIHNFNKQAHIHQALAAQQQQQQQQQGQNPAALLQQQQAALNVQNQLRNAMPGANAQQIAAAQNALLQNMNQQQLPPNISAELAQKIQQQKMLNLQNLQLQGALAQKLAAHNAQNAAKPQQQGQAAQSSQQQQQQQQQQQSQPTATPQPPQANRPQLPFIPDIPFPPTFDNIKHPPNAVAFLKKHFPNLEIPIGSLANWGGFKEWAKQVSPDVAMRVRQLHFLHIQEMAKKNAFVGPMLVQYQEFATRLNSSRQAHLQQAQQQAAQAQVAAQAQQFNAQQQQMSPPKPPVKQPTPSQTQAPTPKMAQQSVEAVGRITPTQAQQQQQQQQQQNQLQQQQQQAQAQAAARNLKRAAEESNAQAGQSNAQNQAQGQPQQQQQQQQQQGQGQKVGDWQSFLQKLLVMPAEMQQQLLNQPKMAQLPTERKMEITKVIAMSRAKLAQNAQNQQRTAALQAQAQAQALSTQQQNQNQAKQAESQPPQRPSTAQSVQQQQQQQQQPKPAAPQAAAPGPQAQAAQIDPAKHILKNKEQVQLIRQEETQRALARPIIPMSDEVKAVMKQAVKESSVALLRMEQWIPMFLMLLPAERIVRELFQTRAAVATQFEDPQFQNTKDNFTITPEDLEAAKSQINRYFNYVKAQVPKLNEQRLKQGQPPIPMSAIPNLQQHQQKIQAPLQQHQQHQQQQQQQAINANQQQAQQAAAVKAPVPNLGDFQKITQSIQQQQQQQQEMKTHAALPPSQLAMPGKSGAPAAPTPPIPNPPPQFALRFPPRKKLKPGSESPVVPRAPEPEPRLPPQQSSQQQPFTLSAPAAAAAAAQAKQQAAGGKGPLDSNCCIVKTCEYHTKPFSNQTELLRHLREDHKDDINRPPKQQQPPPPPPPPTHHPPIDPRAAREKEVRLIEERNKMITNPLEYTLSSVAEALGLNRDGTRKQKEEKPEEKDAKAPTPKAGSAPMSKAPSKAGPVQPSPAKVEPEKTAAAGLPTPPTLGWDDTMISPTVISQAFEGLEEITDLVIDSVDISMILTPDDSDDLFEDAAGEMKLPGASVLPEARNGGDAMEMNEDEMKDFEAWNPFGIRNCGPVGLVEDIDWELIDRPQQGVDSGSGSALSGWDNSFFELRA
ncbi:hypothetical protein AA313_de0201521 [Arthrobotrys entomopaga]|nr:hypothetical protein AA313_de0201521 [Arthrobotrys entomopaga]